MLARIGLNSHALYNITVDFKPLQRELEFVNLLEIDSMDGLDERVSLSFSLCRVRRIYARRPTSISPSIVLVNGNMT